jgi:hypothetical protein
MLFFLSYKKCRLSDNIQNIAEAGHRRDLRNDIIVFPDFWNLPHICRLRRGCHPLIRYSVRAVNYIQSTWKLQPFYTLEIADHDIPDLYRYDTIP